MTPQEINERIAKLCGWVKSVETNTDGYQWIENREYWSFAGRGRHLRPPDYCNSLDACSAFERDLPLGYVYHLIDVLKMDRRAIVEGYDEVQVLQFMRATPAQRCEAFLRVKGQWE